MLAQQDHNLLEDDEFNFSVVTQAVMELKLDTLHTTQDIPYRTYDGSLVNEKDTLYFRIDLWENPEEHNFEGPISDVEAMLDSTLISVESRLKGSLLYLEVIERNGWPARLARYDLGGIRRQAKVLLVRRQSRYYLLTVVSSPNSQHHKSINRFIHTFKIFE